MSQLDEDDAKPWTENDLKEAIRRINAGEINFKEAEDYYGISPRTIHRQRAIENMRAQLNPEKAKKAKSAPSTTMKKDVTSLRKPVDISCSAITDVVALLNTGTEEVKQLLSHECDVIYECKVCKSLFRSLVNFISHKRIYCCDMYSVIHTRNDESEDGIETSDPVKEEEKLKTKENLKEFAAKPFRITCRKDLTAVLKRITAVSEFLPAEPILHLQNIENTSCAFQQIILSNQPSPTCELPEMGIESTKSMDSLLEVSSKTETASTGKSQEKPGDIVKPVNYVAEKRFRCPICHSNFTIKKSVMRHLKSVHHKSVEQLERLKPRIQMSFVKKKTAVVAAENKKQLQEEKKSLVKSPVVANTKVESVCPEQSKSNWEKGCPICDRSFINRNSYAAHIRVCRRNSSSRGSDIDSPDTMKNPLSLLPIVSLTPIRTAPISPTLENEIVSESPTNPAKTMITVSPSLKKVALPLTATSSSSKKIGIQVRMNYHKESFCQANNMNGASALYTTTSSTITSSQSSPDSSRRNSLIISRDAESDAKLELVNGHTTRSSEKLANVLERLLDKQAVKKVEKLKSEIDDSLSETSTNKKLAKNEVSIYCEDCKTMYALNEYKCDVGSEIPRIYKCVLRNCDFRCSDSRELRPHLSARHAIMSEGELAEVDSTFIAEGSERELNDKECGCNKKIKSTNKAKVEERSQSKRENVRVHLTSNPRRDTVASESTQNTLNKRKLSSYPNKQIIAKKKTLIARESTPSISKYKVNENKVVVTPNSAENITENTNNGEVLVKKENSIETNIENNQVHQLPIPKKQKKVLKTEEGSKLKTVTKFVRMKDINLIKDAALVNGDVISSDEEAGTPSNALKSKTNCSLIVRKQNSSALPVYTKNVKNPAKSSNCLHNDLSPSSSTPDIDLDPSTMSDENFKKSIMTIIFGKDVPNAKIDERVLNEREKSPTSSSASSECGKEKQRFSVRIAEQTNTKSVSPSDCKDEKVIKESISKKLKATR